MSNYEALILLCEELHGKILAAYNLEQPTRPLTGVLSDDSPKGDS